MSSERGRDLPEWLRMGLIGWPISHSHSPRIHLAAMKAFDIGGEYKLYPIPPLPEGEAVLGDLLSMMRRKEIHGLNVTIPHKQTLYGLVDGLTEAAREIGAVNTIFLQQGTLIGENTDAPGFLADLERVFSWSSPKNKDEKWGAGRSALVLGAGGAARAVVYALSGAGWSVIVAARRIEQANYLISTLGRYSSKGRLAAIALNPAEISRVESGLALLVNATPLGMSPNRNSSPWPEEIQLPTSAAVYDLVYNPAETRLMRDAREAGLAAVNGMGMLVEQAALAFECWTGLSPSRDWLRRQVFIEEE